MQIRTIAAAPLAVFLCLTLVAEGTDGAGTGQENVSAFSIDRVRVFGPALRSAFDQGMSQSETFVGLVTRLQHSDVIVFLAEDTCPGSRIVGCVVSVHQQGGSRYIRINFVFLRRAEFRALRLSQRRLVAQIGHELQHALEIADEPSIVDARSLERAYTRIGTDHYSARYETDAAIQAGEDVLKELDRHQTANLGRPLR